MSNTPHLSLAVGCVVLDRLIASSILRRKEMGLRLALRLVESVPSTLNLMSEECWLLPRRQRLARDGLTDADGMGSDMSSETCAARLGTEAVVAIRDLPETHEVYKLGERLVKAIERPGGPVAMAHAEQFAADFTIGGSD